MKQNWSFSVESMLNCCDMGGGGGEVNNNIIITMLIFSQGVWTSPLIASKGIVMLDIMCIVVKHVLKIHITIIIIASNLCLGSLTHSN